MEYLVSQAEMKQYDKNTIEYYKVPSVILMERAALVTVEALRKEKGDGNFSVLVVSGCGNNGGDGFAIGRLLMLQGCEVDFVLLGKKDKCSEETALQLTILEKYGNQIYDRIPESEYDIVKKEFIDNLLEQLFEIDDFGLVNISHQDECWKKHYIESDERHNREIPKEEIIDEYSRK